MAIKSNTVARDVAKVRERYLVAIEKGHTIAEATAIANGTFVPQRKAGQLPPPDTEVSGTDDPVALRAEYKAVIGRQAFMGWDAATLRAKIAEAKAGA